MPHRPCLLLNMPSRLWRDRARVPSCAAPRRPRLVAVPLTLEGLLSTRESCLRSKEDVKWTSGERDCLFPKTFSVLCSGIGNFASSGGRKSLKIASETTKGNAFFLKVNLAGSDPNYFVNDRSTVQAAVLPIPTSASLWFLSPASFAKSFPHDGGARAYSAPVRRHRCQSDR